ncbi:protein HEADING DATE 3B [Magnolia sinica]|uniref:protein HEADING DATE 3B n=1 Tax=Magnolia sinica TaxID=86752 RepID=UPI0026587A20|nr:protein HEADING DATE 3B [Magnolia sinica]
MKGGKDEDKVMGPLFPRLHVNDTEKGGPRAPPRNKMALYEQLSIPSQRFNSSASTLPLPPHNTSTMVPSASSSQGGGHERSVFSSFYMPSPTPARSTEKVQSLPSDGVNMNTTMEFERESSKNTGYKHHSPNAKCSSFHPHDFSSSKNTCRKKFGDEDDFRVPTYVHTETVPSSDKDLNGGDKERPTPIPMYPGQSPLTATNSSQKNMKKVTPNLSVQLQNICDKPLKRTNTTDLKSRQRERNQSEERPKDSVTITDSTEKSSSHPSFGEKILVQECPSSSVNVFDTTHNGNTNLYHKASAKVLLENNIHHNGVLVEPRCTTNNGITEKGNVPRVRSVLGSRTSISNIHRSLNEAENHSDRSEGNTRWPLQVDDADRTDDVSETSMVDSMSGLDISPDDVVGMIGQRQFWKARKAIVNQQRVFSVQVFELHRLIKVQKLIASSPHLLLEENAYLGRPPPKVPAKKLPSEYILKPQPHTTKLKDDSQKPNQNTEYPTENTVGKPPPFDNSVSKGFVSQIPTYGPYAGNPPMAPVAADGRSNPWCFHPHGNQWLVPVMSPSEGLVYKPYMGPCPPTAGFMAPVYGSYGPLTLPPVPAYGVPASHQQPGVGAGAPAIAQSYFPSPYGPPVMNPIIPTSAVEQANLSGGSCPHAQVEQVSTAEVNFNMHSRSSCNMLNPGNMSNQRSEAFSCSVRKFQTSKDSELQGSTASSPCERAHRGVSHVAEGHDALHLFPMAPAIEDSNQTPQAHSSDQQTRVIKVVPHNPRSATESAARIFQSIQEERKQYDSL